MSGFEQLNVYGLANLKSTQPQHVHLFRHEELNAQLIVLPPGTEVCFHSHTGGDEVLDVLEGEGLFAVEEKEFRGGPGKSVYVAAGTRHALRNDGEGMWLVRSTVRERLTPRDFGKLLRRSIRARLKIDG